MTILGFLTLPSRDYLGHFLLPVWQQSMIGHRIGQIQILRLKLQESVFSSTILQRSKTHSYCGYAHFSNSRGFISNEIEGTFSLQARKRQINRKYIHNNASFLGLKGKFFELNHELRYTFIDSEKYRSHDGLVSVPLAYGFGRLEPMQQVFNAQFLMDDLLEQGLINEKFTEEELYELAGIMSKVLNTRVFDFRRSRIYQLTELSNWLESKGVP